VTPVEPEKFGVIVSSELFQLGVKPKSASTGVLPSKFGVIDNVVSVQLGVIPKSAEIGSLSLSGVNVRRVFSKVASHPKSYDTGFPTPSLGVIVSVPLPLHSGVMPTS
jgi:hypothetical protein